MPNWKNAGGIYPNDPTDLPWPGADAKGVDRRRLITPALGLAGIALSLSATALNFPLVLTLILAACRIVGMVRVQAREDQRLREAFEALATHVQTLNRNPLDPVGDSAWDAAIGKWNRDWPALCASLELAQRLVAQTHGLPGRLEDTIGPMVQAADR